MKQVIVFLLSAAFSLSSLAQTLDDIESKGKIANTPHNLTASKATQSSKELVLTDYSLCRSCHVPHKAKAVEPLWFRKGGVSSFEMDKALSGRDDHIHPLDPGSRSCLACHDGGLAPAFPHRNEELTGQVNLPTGDNQAPPNYNLHLFKFPSHGLEISPPDESSALSGFSENNEVGCITCHDPHNNERGNFLRVSNEGSAICLECHDMQNWGQSTHGNPQNPLHAGLEEMACNQCHEIHTMPANAKLLRTDENSLCLGCHDGSSDAEHEVASLLNLEETFEKPFTHPIRVNPDYSNMGYDSMEKTPWNYGLADDRRVSCGDCHNPHAATQGMISPALDGSLAFMRGVDANGFSKSFADREYELCYKCHGQNQNLSSGSDISALLNLSNRSFHPVETVGMSLNVPSLKADWSEQSLMTCSDCHGNDDPQGPKGPHGSSIPNILKAAYTEAPFASTSEMALCLTCHDQRIILGNDGFKFHRLHIERAGYSCSACHNPHGSVEHVGLLDLDQMHITSLAGVKAIEITEPGHGTCTLKCHDVTHNLEVY